MKSARTFIAVAAAATAFVAGSLFESGPAAAAITTSEHRITTSTDVGTTPTLGNDGVSDRCKSLDETLSNGGVKKGPQGRRSPQAQEQAARQGGDPADRGRSAALRCRRDVIVQFREEGNEKCWESVFPPGKCQEE